MASRSTDVDAYIAALPPEAADRLGSVRAALHAAIPDGHETIRYAMPAIMLGGGPDAIHFAAWKSHVGLYPVPDLGGELELRVAPLRRSKDTVALRHRDPLPTELVTEIGARVMALRRA